jgi:hypothetical protein
LIILFQLWKRLFYCLVRVFGNEVAGTRVSKKFKFFVLAKNYFIYMFCIVLIRWSQKIFFKNKKIYHFDVFQHEKHFKKQSQLHSQTSPNMRFWRNKLNGFWNINSWLSFSWLQIYLDTVKHVFELIRFSMMFMKTKYIFQNTCYLGQLSHYCKIN